MIFFFRAIFYVLWRIWFYVLMGVPILIMFPLLLILTSSERFYNQFFAVARFWGKIVLYGMGFYAVVEREALIYKKESYMFIANHTSMIDIMLMLAVVKNPFVFVGKKELANIPIFGFFYKRTCILVDRGNVKSRQAVFKRAQKRLQDGVSICIFPEGGVPDDAVLLADFKDGAFRLAILHQIPIVPLTFGDSKKRFPYVFFSGGFGKLRVKVHQFIDTKGLKLADRNLIKTKAWKLLHHQLILFEKEA